MNGWMDGWVMVGGWMDGWWTAGRTSRRMGGGGGDVTMDGWTVDGRTDGRGK